MPPAQRSLAGSLAGSLAESLVERRWRRWALAALVAGTGCTPSIGDKCLVSTDCSTAGTRVCDTSQPNGYCTVLSCTDDSCPNSAACILFQPSVPGCAYDDYQAPARTSRAFCMKTCTQDSDCRESDGYVCRNPTHAPWLAVNFDDNQDEQVCIVGSSSLAMSEPTAAVCSPAPNMSLLDGGTGTDAELTEGAAEAGGDGGPDGSTGGRDRGEGRTPQPTPDWTRRRTPGSMQTEMTPVPDAGADAGRRRRAARRAERRLPTRARVARAGVVRLLEAAAVVASLASLVFYALRNLPGEPARLGLGDEASEADLARVRVALHLDEPLLAQYARFLRGLASLDIGDSFRRPGTRAMARWARRSCPRCSSRPWPWLSAPLAGLAAAVLASGPWLAPRARVWVERVLVAVAAAPLVAFAPLLTWLLAARARLVPLPGDPDAGFAGLLFASSMLALPLGAHVGRIARQALDEVARLPFLTVASAKGAGPVRVWLVHALPVVTGPVVTVVATQLGALLGGAVVIERMFERRGLGTLILEAYAARDLPVLEGAVVAAGMLFVAAQAIGTAIHVAVDPRARGAS